jgi:hypothetical protein
MSNELRYPTVIKDLYKDFLNYPEDIKLKAYAKNAQEELSTIKAEEIHPFVFMDFGKPPGSPPIRFDVQDTPFIDLPFEHCIFEAAGGAVLFKYTNTGHLTTAIMVKEYGDSYVFVEEFFRPSNNDYCVRVVTPEQGELYTGLKDITNTLCKRLHDKDIRLGSVKCKDKFKNNRRSSSYIKEVVCVTGERYTNKNTKLVGKNIQWSHSWKSCGHWRKVKGIGKNRKGDYCLEGRTWVRPCVKGNKVLEPIQKTRVVQAKEVA